MFFKLPKTKAWFGFFTVTCVSVLSVVAFIWTMIAYNRECYEAIEPQVDTLLLINSIATFLFFASMALVSAALGSSIQDYRGVHSLKMRINTFVTLFVGLIYSMRTFMSISTPVVSTEVYSTYSIVMMIPLCLLVIYKIFLSVRLMRRRLPRVGLSLLIFWSLFLLSVVVVSTRTVTSPDNVFSWPVVALMVVASLMYVNTMLRYGATSLTLTYYPLEYEKDLEQYERSAAGKKA